MSSRIYKAEIVIPLTDEDIKRRSLKRTFLVDGSSQGQSKAFVGGKFITCAIAKPRELVKLMGEGIEVENASEDMLREVDKS